MRASGVLAGGWPDGLDDEISEHVFKLEKAMGRKLGDPLDPLLVSVRSGAKFSMPGMMDTVLNLGLNDESVEGLATVTGDDALRVRLVPPLHRDVRPDRARRRRRAVRAPARGEGAPRHQQRRSAPGERAEEALQGVPEGRGEKATGEPFPQRPRDQLRGAIEAVFKSWNGARAIAYRVREKISHDLGTAVNVQTMVFGNRDDNSGTGVGFTRNAATGENKPYGDFLVNAQGEDVVAGIRNTEDLDHMAKHFPGSTTSCSTSSSGSRRTTRTCATPSSRSSRASSGCSRRASASAPAPPRCDGRRDDEGHKRR
jgi:pyruvate, orthophosphate dikinase